MVVDSSGVGATAANSAGAIRHAAQATGASFDYLLTTAKVESNLDPGAQASTSSAGGLFQFIEQTWLSVLKLAGPALGYGRYADAIVQSPSGGYTVPDASMRAEVMNLRRDPAANAAMAGAFTEQNAADLQRRLGRPASAGELYIAHFLGAGGATKLIALAESKPKADAADLFPAAAAANPSVFFDARGKARGAGEVYAALVGRFQAARAAVTRAGGMTAQSAAGGEAADFSATSGVFARAIPIASSDASTPAFHRLFQTGGSRQPISPVVASLWGGNAPASNLAASPSTLDAAIPAPARPDLHGLYQTGGVNIRGLFDGRS